MTKYNKEDQYRADFIKEFGELLVKHGGKYESCGVHHARPMELLPDGITVRVYWENGEADPDKWYDVNVNGDALLFCIYDICRQAF